MCLIEDQSWIDCIDITSRWDTFVSFHLYGNKGVSLPLWPIRPRWFHTYSPCAESLGDGHEGMWARFRSQGSIALNWHSRYSGTRYSGTWLYLTLMDELWGICCECFVEIGPCCNCTVWLISIPLLLLPGAPLTLIPAWISNHMPSKMWDEITYPFPNFNSCTVEVWEWISNFIPRLIMDAITYPC